MNTYADQHEARLDTAPRSAVLLVFFLMGAELFVLPPMLSRIGSTFGSGRAATAWVVTAYVIAYAASTPFFGVIGARNRRRRVVVAGSAVFAVGMAGCVCAPSLPLLLAAHAIAGLGGALLSPAVWAYLADTAHDGERARAIAYGAAAYNGGQILGVPAGAVIASVVGWRFAFAVVGALMLLGCAWVRLSMRDKVAESSESFVRDLRHSVGLWSKPIFRSTVVATTLSQAARLGAYTYIADVFTPRFGMSVIQLGLVGGGVGMGSLAGALAAGPLNDRWRSTGRSPALLCCGWGLLLAAALVVALTVESPGAAIAALAVWFAAGGAFYSTGQAMLAEAVAQRRAAAVSWNNAAMNAGVALGSAGLGVLQPISTEFWIAASSLALAASAVSATAARRSSRETAHAHKVGRDRTDTCLVD